MVRLRVKDFKVKVLVTQSCPTFCDHMDCRPSDSPVHGILQARILECVAIPFSRGSSWPRDGTRVQCCRQVLYHLSHQGSPESLRNTSNIFLRILLVHLFKTNKQTKKNKGHVLECDFSLQFLWAAWTCWLRLDPLAKVQILVQSIHGIPSLQLLSAFTYTYPWPLTSYLLKMPSRQCQTLQVIPRPQCWL